MQDLKNKVAKVLAARVKSGEVLGLGSGSTVEATIMALGERIRAEKLQVSGVPSSHHIGFLAEAAGIHLLAPVSNVSPDWCFDGADEVDPDLNMIKGGGAAMLNEKIVAERSKRLVIVVHEEKLVPKLGTKFAIPVEIIPEAVGLVQKGLEKLGASKVELRTASRNQKYGPVVTEHNNLIYDAWFKDIRPELDQQINVITGVVNHGLFINRAHEVLVAKADGVYSLEHGGKSKKIA